MDEDSILRLLIRFVTNRLFVMSAITVVLFMCLVFRLFNLQIVQGEQYLTQITASVTSDLPIEAPRGLIYDKYGRPLAINNVVFNLKLDGSVGVSDRNEMLLNLIAVLDANDELIIDDIPISQEQPYYYLFNNSESREQFWKREVGIEDQNMEAPAAYQYLCTELFKVPKGLEQTAERKLLALNYHLYMSRFDLDSVTVSKDIKNETVAVIEEKNDLFPGAQIDVEPHRYYPGGEEFAHIVGYLGAINEQEYETLKDAGYKSSDTIGKIGIEKSMESQLRGKDGLKTVEIDPMGRIIGSETAIEPVPGDKIYLTIDSYFQKKVAEILEDTLIEVQIRKMEGKVSGQYVTAKDLMAAMVMQNTISVEKIWASEDPGQVQYSIKTLIADEFDRQQIELVEAAKEAGQEDVEKAVFSINNTEHVQSAKNILAGLLDDGSVSPKQVARILFEQGKLENEEDLNRLDNGQIAPVQLVKEKLLTKELSPQDTGIDPATGGVVVTDVNTGEIVAMVTYPSYDNNRYINDMEYYRVINNDPSTPLVNRATMTRKAPGSTFKMLTAIAGLEEGIITPTTTIRDVGQFTKAGEPFAACWIYNQSRGAHGFLNVTGAIEVSCNYFFYETVYRMGNASTGNRLDSIGILNRYMEYFGLADYSGVEIEEYKPLMASPEYKESSILSREPEASERDTRWSDGDTIRAAIGQSLNSFAPAHMAKYVATLANGGTRYKSTLISKTESFWGDEITLNEPYVELQLNLDQNNLDAVFSGMLDGTSGSRGTARNVFSSLPISIAGKTGTAQESQSRPSHTWFVGFAPYDNPQISIAVMIPYGEMPMYPAAVITREVVAEYMGLNDGVENNPMVTRLAQ